ncbi:hypothetical protein F2Q68_00046115 [Brassica cretica]|uniref:Serine/threonine-protein kinase BSK n=1 Tax=Brassica cretica TaxID=69181 RepID=A0A8S9LH60_BRACR|nr:hypothetical protein F2Q68_00046115 [Brassica cretica]
MLNLLSQQTSDQEEAKRVGELKHKRFVSLIGCCADGDERLLVAEFLPNDTLAKRLFHDNNNTLEWSMRLKVACGIAEALDYCSTKGFTTSFSNLSANSILFDDGDNACLSCFGLMKESEDGQTTSFDQFTSVAYKFGCVLLNLLTGKEYLDHAAMVHGQHDVTEFLDPKLERNFPTEEAILVLGLAAQCMKQDSNYIPTSELLQIEKQHQEASPSGQENPPSPLPTTSQFQGPPKKPANKTAGSRRSCPRRRHKATTTQNDEEREAKNKATFEKWKKKKQAEQNGKKEEKPKSRQTKPVQGEEQQSYS